MFDSEVHLKAFGVMVDGSHRCVVPTSKMAMLPPYSLGAPSFTGYMSPRALRFWMAQGTGHHPPMPGAGALYWRVVGFGH